MANAYATLKKRLKTLEGVSDVAVDKAEEDDEDGGVLPATLTLRFEPSKLGMHALEFVAWAFEDIGRAGAQVHVQVAAPPPWLNTPGEALSVNVYVNPRTDESDPSLALREIEEEIEGIAAFLKQVQKEYWPLCRP